MIKTNQPTETQKEKTMTNQNRINVERANTIRVSDLDETVIVWIMMSDGGELLRHKRVTECADDLFERVNEEGTIDLQYWRELTSEELEIVKEERAYTNAEEDMEREQYRQAVAFAEGMNGRI